jgi:hypothetical protein
LSCAAVSTMRHSGPVMQHFLTHIMAMRAAEPDAKG